MENKIEIFNLTREIWVNGSYLGKVISFEQREDEVMVLSYEPAITD